jgi:hypothetical protein
MIEHPAPSASVVAAPAELVSGFECVAGKPAPPQAMMAVTGCVPVVLMLSHCIWSPWKPA